MRPGQVSDPVFVYKLIIEDSVEEKILTLQEQKKQLSNVLYSEKEEGVSRWMPRVCWRSSAEPG